MNDKDLINIIEQTVSYTISRFKNTSEYKNTAKITQAKIVSLNEENTIANVQLPFDKNIFPASIETKDKVDVGDNVFLLYWGDLKNAHIVFKNKNRE